MKPSLANRVRSAGKQANVRIILLVLGFFVLGIAVGAFWFFRPAQRGGQETNGRPAAGLSDSTRAILQRLDTPVEIRSYALLDPRSVSDSLRSFAERVDRLLSAYELEADGKIKVVRRNSGSDNNTAATAATADGIQAFNQDKGDSCFLGLVNAGNGQKVVLSRLDPEWEQALEPDLRVRALRQHLLEIHQREEAERRERRLTHRLSKLWSRTSPR